MNMEQAITEAIGKMAGRKNGAAIIAMAFLYAMAAPTWQVFGIGLVAIGMQFLLDLYEVSRVGRDLPDNGHGELRVLPEQAGGPQGPAETVEAAVEQAG